MKKYLAILAISALAASAFAQGTINFQNQTGLVKQWTATDNTVLISVPKSTGYLQLIGASAGTPIAKPFFTAVPGGVTTTYSSLAGWLSDNPGWALASNANGQVPAIIGFGNGLFSDGTYTIPSTVLGAGLNAEYIVLGWANGVANNGITLANAIAAPTGWFAGQSAIFTTATSDPAGTGTPIDQKNRFGGATLAPLIIPEPTTFALAGLGLAALLVFRRRS